MYLLCPTYRDEHFQFDKIVENMWALQRFLRTQKTIRAAVLPEFRADTHDACNLAFAAEDKKQPAADETLDVVEVHFYAS